MAIFLISSNVASGYSSLISFSTTEMFSVKPNTTYTYSVDITASTNAGSVELFVILYEEDNIPNTTDIMSTSFIPADKSTPVKAEF